MLLFSPGARSAWRRYAQAHNLTKAVASEWPVSRNGEAWEIFKDFVAEQYPMSPTQPFLLKEHWWNFFNREEVKLMLGMPITESFTLETYNRLFGTSYESQAYTPFPVPSHASPKLQEVWREYQIRFYPRRLIVINNPDEHVDAFRASLEETYRTITAYNEVNSTTFKSFSEIPLPAQATTDNRGNAGDWQKFVGTLDPSALTYNSAESAFQAYLLKEYGSLEGVNNAYGWKLSTIEEVRIPLAEATTISFVKHEWRFLFADIGKNYRSVVEYLTIRGRAFLNTFIFILIAMSLSLTVNPIAAYALSRFQLKWTEQILLFLIATMAFPGAVTAIPSFLLLRVLQFLNTFYALFLPGMANGMAIFILKCFFDGLPRELYEAASIDGAREWQMFVHISLPMTTPILAINALNAFIGAYNSWEWALIVCQKQTYWTVAVWLYQMAQTWTQYPWLVMAAFVLASIPTAIVFITCQKVILRGIVLPSMK